MVEFVCNIPFLRSLTEAPKITAWNSYQLMNIMRSKEGSSCNFSLIIWENCPLLHSGYEVLSQAWNDFCGAFKNSTSSQATYPNVQDTFGLWVSSKQGLGHMMFEFMLEQEKSRPCQLGYDKPSDLLLFFMIKHYKLRSFNSQANQFVVYNDYFEDPENHRVREKENCEKEPKIVPDIGRMSRTERVLHGRRANPQEGEAEEPCNSSSPDSNRLASSDSRPTVATLPQPSFHRGRRKNWKLKADDSEKLPSFIPPDTRHSLRSPIKAASLPLKDAYRQELSEQGKILKARKHPNSQGGDQRKWHDTHGFALKTCSNPQEHDSLTPLFSIIGEEERLKIQSICPPSLAQKMNYKNTSRCQQDLRPLKPHPMGRSNTRQIAKIPSKEPPPSYPFWTEAKELSSSHQWQERNPVDYRRSRACC